LSNEPFYQILKDFGITDKEANIYLLVAKHGALRSTEVTRLSGNDKAEVYRILTNLQNKGLIERTLEAPTRFSAVPFEKVIDSFIKNKRDEAEIIEKKKTNLIEDWKKIVRTQADYSLERFIVIEDWRKIYPRVLQIIKNAKTQLLCISTVEDILKAEQYGLSEAILTNPNQQNVKFRFISETSNGNLPKLMNLLSQLPTDTIEIKGKSKDFKLNQSPKMVSRDNEELIVFIDSNSEINVPKKEVALWTNCKTIVQSFSSMFEELWNNSEDINRKLDGMKNVKNEEPKITEKIYFEKLKSAKEEVLIITSFEGLTKLGSKKRLINHWIEKGISVKIMAPVVHENFKQAKQLSKLGLLKHVPESFVGVTIIDSKELLQPEFRYTKKPNFVPDFSSTDAKYVNKIRENLKGFWNNAQVISLNTLESITGPTMLPIRGFENAKTGNNSLVCIKSKGTPTEKDIINKINASQKYIVKDPNRDVNVVYCSAASAVIHPPSEFNLPNLFFVTQHIDKNSSFGEADVLEIYLGYEKSKGIKYVISGGLGTNSQGVAYRKTVYKGTPFEKNYQLVDKDKLQVKIFGNNLFVGWTVPIPLMPPQYVLKPGCLIFEGYGDVKTKAWTSYTLSGAMCEREQNWLDAFVTFMHSESKYSGPGTDGAFVRDLILTLTPPTNLKQEVQPTNKITKKLSE
jgi:HTH-type transcriptional regulator, sugar sensing transcriptional regulator